MTTPIRPSLTTGGYCIHGVNPDRDCARCGEGAIRPSLTMEGADPVDTARHHATLTLSPKFGAALLLDNRIVARITASVEASRITPDAPTPQWKKDALVFVNAVNQGALSSEGEGLDVAVWLERDVSQLADRLVAAWVAGVLPAEATGVASVLRHFARTLAREESDRLTYSEPAAPSLKNPLSPPSPQEER